MEPQGTRGERTGTQGTAVHGLEPRTPDWVSGMIVTSAMTVHSRVGPGLLERAYEAFLARELENRGLSVRRQVHLPLEYDGERVEMAYRLDLLVEEQVIVEVKAVAKVLPIHKAQLLSYLRLTGLHVGLLLNFHELRLKNGITRMRD